MMRTACVVIVIFSFGQSVDAQTRQHDAHEHGVGKLNIAFEGHKIAMEFEAPGADIVGFEHPAEHAQDLEKIDAAIATLTSPLELFVLPAAAKCSVVKAKAALIDDSQDKDDHNAHGDEHHDEHDEHEQATQEEKGESHSEFHAEYVFSCADPVAIDQITFRYFDVFSNAEEIDVQLISDKGTAGFEVDRDAPVVSLADLI